MENVPRLFTCTILDHLRLEKGKHKRAKVANKTIIMRIREEHKTIKENKLLETNAKKTEEVD